jgi:uncharacterized protein YtpQ (UPF0354 family)
MFGWLKKKEKATTVPEPEASQIVPRLKNAQFGEYLASQGVPPDQCPVIEPLVADLFVTYAFDMEAGFMMVAPYHLEALGLQPGALRELAMANLKSRMPNVEIRSKDGLSFVHCGDNLEACSLLSTNLWTTMSARMPGGIVAMVPTRDHVLFCEATDAEARKRLLVTGTVAYASGGNHALSVSILRRTDTGWAEEPAAAAAPA